MVAGSINTGNVFVGNMKFGSGHLPLRLQGGRSTSSTPKCHFPKVPPLSRQMPSPTGRQLNSPCPGILRRTFSHVKPGLSRGGTQ